MFTKYLNEIIMDNKDKILGNESIYEEDFSEVDENKTYTVTILQPSDAIIEVVVNGSGTPKTSSFTAAYDDVYEVGFKNGSNPSNLVLNAIKGKVTRNITIQAYGREDSDKHKTYTITITQSPNQTISVLCNGVVRTSTFQASKYDFFTVEVTADDGYKAGLPNIRSGVVDNNVSISATAAELDERNKTVTITQVPHQKITVTCNGKNYTKSFAVLEGARYTVNIKADEGYTAGTIVDPGDGIVTGDIVITANPATKKVYEIFIVQSAHQTIYVKYNDEEYSTDFSHVSYGTQLTAKIKADDGWNAGKLNQTKLVVTSNFTFKATSSPTRKDYTITLGSTTNQTITLKYKVPGGSWVTVKSSKTDQEIIVPYETEWNATIAAKDSNYLPGTLSGTSGIITKNILVTASAATLNKYTLTINVPIGGYVVVDADGVTTTFTSSSTLKVTRGATVKVYAVANDDYKVDKIVVE